MKTLNSILLAAFALATGAFAQNTATTEPIGFNSITCLGNSDTRFSIPFHRPTVFQGAVQSVNGGVITLQGTPAWTTSQFVYVAGQQTNTYYVEFGSGSKEGLSYTITANDASSVTVNLNGDTLQGVVAQGDSVRIIPYWTLSTLFPSQTGITGTTSISGAGSMTRVFVPDVVTAGINLAASASYYYYTGTGFGGAGWRKQGGGLTAIKNDDLLPPDLYVLIRQDGVGTSTILTGTGSVPMTTTGATKRKYVLATLQANTPQDNAIALDIPVPLTLTASNLFESGAFVGTSSISGSSGDKVFVFDDSVAALNKAAGKSYYYYTGASFGGPGWRRQGGGFTNIVGTSETVFQPGSGVIIRKDATPAPTTVVWTIPLSY